MRTELDHEMLGFAERYLAQKLVQVREMLGQGLDRTRLGKTGKAFDQEIAACEQPDQHALDQMILAEHGLSDARLEIEHGVAGG